MGKFTFIKRPFIWLGRFRHRCGYGVHSPSAFDFITGLIYEKLPYYAYGEIESKHPSSTRNRRINRLLFRLTNRYQPVTVVDIGPRSTAEYYIRAAKKDITYLTVSQYNDLSLSDDPDLLYIHDMETHLVEKCLEHSISFMKENSVMVIAGIKKNKSMKLLWEKITKDDRVSITFDLYDLGILFFDHSKIKQNYIVNF